MTVAIFVIVCIALYFLPTIIAIGRGHRQQNSIAALNTFLGWTFIG